MFVSFFYGMNFSLNVIQSLAHIQIFLAVHFLPFFLNFQGLCNIYTLIFPFLLAFLCQIETLEHAEAPKPIKTEIIKYNMKNKKILKRIC